ncbi:phage tail fiber protein [Citrobacter freundii]|uniref:phage tail fiber protein n=1 Tax=Citrobacter freundii TaxID=546 RepID=UPI0008FD8B81|nr:phage tail protein [Citrobacter freundii]MDH0767858.1 phage tail protein [Citrobacter freundii]MDH1001307.1 phage tail protein [Citrobacter freundii]MDH1810404.1 phage tail protein [Citrobacter freundii]MDH1963742.1 phage tail protein [Citrobacter freundii]MDT7338293.1 phage tail protein [Citrobacter freundii]
MSAGTLTLTHNSAAAAGSGTAFTTEVAAGDFIVVTVGGVPYTLPIKSVESGTALTLVSNFTGPTQAGAAWSAVPRVALNMVTAALVAQSAEALRGLNYDKQNWQQVFSAPGMINVKLPDGSSFPGPSWKYLADQVGNIDSDTLKKSNNLSDVVDKAQSRSNLGLKALAVKSTVELSGDDTTGILPLSKGGSGFGTTAGLRQAAVVHGVDGAFGSINNILTYFNTAASNAGVFSFRDIAGDATATYQWSASVLHRTSDTYSIFSVNHANGNVKVASGSVSGGIASTFNQNTLWGTRNTTVDGNGFIKQASPIVIIHREGAYETNHESEGCAVERISVGEYLITGCIGLNADAAWGGIDGGFEIPVDRNKQPRIWLDYKVNADGSVLVRTFHRVHPSAPPFAQNRIGNTDNNGVFTETVADGEPVDIPADSFVSVRVEMPEDSIWNRMQKETREAIEKAERERQQNQQDTQL